MFPGEPDLVLTVGTDAVHLGEGGKMVKGG